MKGHVQNAMKEANPQAPPRLDTCLVCMVRETGGTPQECERMVKFLLFCGMEEEIFSGTPYYYKCKRCRGQIPLGKDKKNFERGAEMF